MTDKMTAEQAIELLDGCLGTADQDFKDFVDALPAKHWSRYDLSAVRIGWHHGRRLLRQALSAPRVPEGFRSVIEEVRDLIAGAPIDSLGTVHSEYCAPWPIRDEVVDRLTAMLAASPEPVAPAHPDDIAVDRFAEAMKAKLAAARAKGRSGWDDPEQCTVAHLANLLAGHTLKGNAGNFIDVANFAMMLHMREADPEVMPWAFAFLNTEPHSQQVIADLRQQYDTLLAKHQDVLDEVQLCGCAYDGPQDVCIGHAKVIADLRAEVEALKERVKVLEDALSDAASYTRHNDYDWDTGFIKEVDHLLTTRQREGGE